MKVKVKTLTGAATEFELEPTDTVLSLKEKVAAQHGADVNAVRLAFSGRVLNNPDTLEASRVKDGDTLIAVIPKAKPAPKPAPAAAPKPDPVPAAAPAPAPAPSEPEKPATTEAGADKPAAPEGGADKPSSEPIPEAQPATQPAAPAQPRQPAFQVDDAEVEKLVAMGFPRDECVQALRLAFNNADRAVQFLLEGLPAGGDVGGDDMGDDGDDDAGSGGGVPMTSSEAFQRLISDPQFQQLRAAIQANPMLLEGLLNQLKQQNPMIYNLIMQNREEFSHWLSAGAAPGGAGGMPSAGGAGGAGGAGVRPPAGAQLPPGSRLIPLDLSEEDRNNIQSLVEMGFSQGDAIQAYIACDKNIQLAANLLMGGF